MNTEARIKALIEANRNRSRVHCWEDVAAYHASPSVWKRKAAEALSTVRSMRQIRTEQGRNYSHTVAVHMARVDEFLSLARAA